LKNVGSWSGKQSRPWRTGELIAEKPRAKPNPTVEVRESLPDGTEFKAVWSLLRESGVAKLVTVHFFDKG
jgi:hypothetical protein